MTDAKQTATIEPEFFAEVAAMGDSFMKACNTDDPSYKDRLFGPVIARCHAHIVFDVDLPLEEEDRVLTEKTLALGPCLIHARVGGQEMLTLFVHTEKGQILGVTPVPSHLRPTILNAAQEIVGMFVGQGVAAMYTTAVGATEHSETATAMYVMMILNMDSRDALYLATTEGSKLSKMVERALRLRDGE